VSGAEAGFALTAWRLAEPSRAGAAEEARDIADHRAQAREAPEGFFKNR
jgi:hypothetical protein